MDPGGTRAGATPLADTAPADVPQAVLGVLADAPLGQQVRRLVVAQAGPVLRALQVPRRRLASINPAVGVPAEEPS